MKNCFYPADILLPKFANDADKMRLWSCVACDQYTSEPEYWDDVEKLVGDAPSTLRVTLPEIYLSEAEKRIPAINSMMADYMEDVFVEHKNSMIFLERHQNNGKIRRGLVGAIDLECYDYNKGAKSLVRATEGTVLERIPPRIKIREGAPVELPHIMILIDDPEKSVIEPLLSNSAEFEAAYDFELMKNGGRAVGRFLPQTEIERVSMALESLCKKAEAEQMCDSPLVFAMGDGNHSLASAKAFWEQLKLTLSDAERESHPARYALCEIVNIHDDALEFEPIYRVVFGAEPMELMGELESYIKNLPASDIQAQAFEFFAGAKSGKFTIDNPTSLLPVGSLQAFLDSYVRSHEGVSIDYIHGVESTKKLASGEKAIGFLFEGMGKSELFPTVVRDGALPRKTFSMGEADDKRYYLEARKIRA